jgi:hypothetical protein
MVGDLTLTGGAAGASSAANATAAGAAGAAGGAVIVTDINTSNHWWDNYDWWSW